MPNIMFEESIAAGGGNSNLVSGSAFEFAKGPQVVSIGVTAAAAGMFVQIQSGGDVVCEEFSPPVATLYPKIPDEMYFTDAMDNGDRLRISVRNPTAGAIVIRGVVQISSL